jgi:hypothetical protein
MAHVVAGCDLSHIPLLGTMWAVERSEPNDRRSHRGRLLNLPSVRQRYERAKSACEEGRELLEIEFAVEELEAHGITELRADDYIKIHDGGMGLGNRGQDIWLICDDTSRPTVSRSGRPLSPQVDRPIIALAEALTQNTSLTKLIIGPGPWEKEYHVGYTPGRNSGFDRCWLSIPAINALAEMFRQNSTLEQLYLGKDSLSIM